MGSILALLLTIGAADAPAEDIARGVAMVKEGDFENAVTPLSAAIQALNSVLSRRDELARAYLYLGVAYLELGQELEARGKFREALRNEPKLKLSPREFSAQVQRVFEAERLAAQPKKKRNVLPFVLVLGGGAASAGVAVAAAAGGDEPTTTAAATTPTTSQPTGGGGGTTTTTTSTTQPGGPGSTTTTTTTLPGATTTTTTSSTTSTTTTSTTTTTTLPPACQYSLAPDRTFQLGGGTGVCNVSVTPSSCAWSVEVFPGSAGWLSLNGPTSGTGNGSVSYSVAALQLVGSRTAQIRAQQDAGASCTITQQGLIGVSEGGIVWRSRLTLAGGRGQVVVNGADVTFVAEGEQQGRAATREGPSRIEAVVVDAAGKPGAWRFELAGHDPGSLHVIAGRVTAFAPDGLTFAVSGAAGERIVFAFRAARPRPDPR